MTHINRTIARCLAAAALLVVGGVHIQQYLVEHYASIPTIGPLFLLNFIAATVTGLVLLARAGASERRFARLIDDIAAIAGIGISAGALTALLISERTPLFGFMEQGYRTAIVVAIASEAAAIVLLTAFLASARRRAPAASPAATSHAARSSS